MIKFLIKTIITICIIGAIGFFAFDYMRNKTIGELLTENKHLKQAISNLTSEEQIGYAKVIKQEYNNERIYTTLLFVETDRNDKTSKILEKTYTIEGNVIYFDAIIVKFKSPIVQEGKEKALYLWRRVYGENMTPNSGFLIEAENQEPARYKDLLTKLRLKDKETFWLNIWDLANDPKKLNSYGIDAIYGNAVYSQLKPGLIYIFKINPSGQVYPETVPEI